MRNLAKYVVIALAAMAGAMHLHGGTRTWNGPNNGAWETAANWSPVGHPGPLDRAIIKSGNVTITAPADIGALTVSNNATLTFANWTTRLNTAGDMEIVSGALVTANGPFNYQTAMSNRVWLVCHNFSLKAGGKIDLDNKGYFTHTGPGKGIGYDSNDGGGAGHGGKGGKADHWNSTAGVAYDSQYIPLLPGSGGGGGYDNSGGHGGGAALIEARGHTRIDGLISANAFNDSRYNGGGSGGSIMISTHTFEGAASGVMRANGADKGTSYELGGGSGGRIAIWLGPALERYLEQGDRLIDKSPTNRFYKGTVAVDPGSSAFSPPSPNAPEKGTAWFFTETPNRATLLILR